MLTRQRFLKALLSHDSISTAASSFSFYSTISIITSTSICHISTTCSTPATTKMESTHYLLLLGLLLLLSTTFVEGAAHAGEMIGGLGVRAQRWWRNDWESVEPTLAVTSRNVTAVVGQTASLPCRVHNLHDKTVSWIRTRDLTVLAVDRFTVTTDKRFSVVHPEETEDWLLEIRGVKASDSTTYECQINTHPKISCKVHLHVLLDRDEVSIFDVPVSDSGIPSNPTDVAAPDIGDVQVQIEGALQQTVEEETPLKLECVAEGKGIMAAHASSRGRNDPLILWTLDDVPVTTLWKEWKVSVSEEWESHERVVSHLTVRSVIGGDGGLYACAVPHAQPSIIYVQVLSQDDIDAPSYLATSPDDPAAAAAPHTVSASAQSSRSKLPLVLGLFALVLILQLVVCVLFIRTTSH